MNRRFQASIVGGSLLVAAIFAGTIASNYPGVPCIQGQTCFLGTGGNVVTNTTAPLNFFVDPALGSDSNPCTSSGNGACLTIPGAWYKKPKFVQNPVTFNLACGTYDGGTWIEADHDIYNPSISGALPNGSPSVSFVGPYVAATVATGPQTGTFTSAAQGGTANASQYGTFTLTGANWTVNNLTNDLIQITGGTDQGDLRPIRSNTATVGTIEGNWVTTPDSTSTFALVTTCATIQDGIKQDGFLAPSLIGPASYTNGTAFIVRGGPSPQTQLPNVIFKGINFNPVNGGNAVTSMGNGSNVLAYGNTFTNVNSTATSSQTFCFLNALNGARITAIANVFTPSVALQAVCTREQPGDTGGLTNWTVTLPTSLVLKYNIFNYSTMGITTLNLQNSIVASYQNTLYTSSPVAGGVEMGEGTHFTTQGDYFVVDAGFGWRINGFADDAQPVTVTVRSAQFAGNGGTTEGIEFLTTAGAAIQWQDANSTISNFGYAYDFESNNAVMIGNLVGNIPTPSGSTSGDLFADCYGFGASQTLSWATVNASSGQFLDECNNQISQLRDGYWAWLNGNLVPGTAAAVNIGIASSPITGINASSNENLGGTLDAGAIIIPSQKAATGKRFLCIDTNGGLVSSASACSGT